jgi:glycosyltransferase involved in cell wall biosynthesis
MSKSIKIGIVTTHPIQYQVPLFREISGRDKVNLSVFYGRIPDVEEQGEGFGTAFTWDLPLLRGYSWRVQEGNVDRGEVREENTFNRISEAYREVDIMLIHGWQSAYMRRVWWKGIWEDVPLLVRGESNSMKPRSWYVRALHYGYLRPFDRYLYIGETNRQFYRKAGVSSEALCSAPYCVENSRFDSDWRERKEEKASLRSEFGIGEVAVCFLFCGKFIEKKRPTDVVEGFLQAWHSSNSPMHLLMVGDGTLRDEVENLAPDDAPITFTGFLNQTEIGAAYAAADTLVLPSNYGETWGLVVNEGMIFECPAIVSDRVGCGPDLIREGKTGYTVPFENIKVLAGTMNQMASHPARVAEMGRNARQLVLSEYTIKKAADGIVEAALEAHQRR